MRWTQENEQILWRTIFETQELHIDLDKVAEAWPADDKPTPKALSEQLHKYRKNSKGTNNVTLSMGKRKAGDSAQSTPRKRASPKKATPKKAAKEKETVKDEASPVKKESVKEESKYDYA